jgi:hypothetical protein
VQSSQAEFRAHVVDCVFFLFAAVFAWSEIAILRFLISGRRPTLKGYLIRNRRFCDLLVFELPADLGEVPRETEINSCKQRCRIHCSSGHIQHRCSEST